MGRIYSKLVFGGLFHRTLCLLIACVALQNALAQTTVVSGKVVDEEHGLPLVGASVVIWGTSTGVATDVKGEFTLSTTTQPPFRLVFSFVGHNSVEKTVTGNVEGMRVTLSEKVVLGKEIVVSASLAEENIMRAPATIEKLDITALKRMPAANFYDGLSSLNGVDLTTHSLLFKVPNTRGFNSNTGVRMGQYVDGMDNAAPGLSFAAGNIFGVGPLDLESVELLVGASSALYGTGSMNGTLLMTSKSPFDYQGLSASLQLGVMNINATDAPASPMGDVNIRYAEALNDKWAFKTSVGFLRAEDWRATDYRDRRDLSQENFSHADNPGYDGLNVYGDETPDPVNANVRTSVNAIATAYALTLGHSLGTPEYQEAYDRAFNAIPDQIVSRTGYKEKDLVDYGTQNLRANVAIHRRLREDWEAIFQAGYSNGTSVYTAENRFSLKNFSIFSGKLELKSPRFHVRSYAIVEDAGDTYDVSNTALLMNEAWKPSEVWYADLSTDPPGGYIPKYSEILITGGTLFEADAAARTIADEGRPLPGTAAFNQLRDSLSRKPVNQGGTRVIDRSKMWHSEAIYNFKKEISFMELIAGVSYRLFAIDSEGTIFTDKPGDPIIINQFGSFVQLGKSFWQEKLKVQASARYDKNQFFKGRVTPRVSMVYGLDADHDRNVRASFQTAFRFPTIADQWVDINTGAYRIVGGQQSVQNARGFNSFPTYPLDSSNPLTGQPILEENFVAPAFRPEEVTAIEVGYKGLHMSKMLLIDGYLYRNEYSGFLAQQAVRVQNPTADDKDRTFLTTVSTDFPVLTYGWALSMDMMMPKGFRLHGNVNYNTFETVGTPPKGYRTNFNTPDYRYNVALQNSGLVKNTSFSVNWRWQEAFQWESSVGVGEIPAFGTLDAAVSMNLPHLHSSVKIGGSNLLNRYYTTALGSAQVGGLYYVTWTLDHI